MGLFILCSLLFLLVFMFYLMGAENKNSNDPVHLGGDSADHTILRILFSWLIK